MRKVLLLKEKRSWWRLLLPAAMATIAGADMAAEHLLKNPEAEAAALALAATAANRLQSPVVTAQALAATAANRPQSLREIMVSRRQNPASD